MRFVSQIQKADDKEKFVKIIFVMENTKIRWKRFDYIFFCNKTFAEKFHQLIIKNLRKIVLVKQSVIICLYFDLFSNRDISRYRDISIHFKMIIVIINLIKKTRKIVLIKDNCLPPF